MATCSLHQNDRLDAEYLKSEGIVFDEKETHKEAGKRLARSLSLLTCMGCLYAHPEKPFCIEGYEISSDTGAEGYLIQPPGGRSQTVVLWIEHQCGAFHGQTSLRFLKANGDALLTCGFVLGRSSDIICALQTGATVKELHKRTLMAHLDSVAGRTAGESRQLSRCSMKSKALKSTAGQTPRASLYAEEEDDDDASTWFPRNVADADNSNVPTIPEIRRDSAVHPVLSEESHNHTSEIEKESRANRTTSTTAALHDLTRSDKPAEHKASPFGIDFSTIKDLWTIKEARKADPKSAKEAEDIRATTAERKRKRDELQKALDRVEEERKKRTEELIASDKQLAAAELEEVDGELRLLEERAMKMGFKLSDDSEH